MHKFFYIFCVTCLMTSVLCEPKSMKELEIAFAKDGYDIVKHITFQGKKGILAQHRTAKNYETREHKRVFYLEGNSYQMGYMMGMLAPKKVEIMSTEFIDKILLALINVKVDPQEIPQIMAILRNMVVEGAKKARPDIPQQYIEEIQGVVDGCKKADPNTKVTFDSLLFINAGLDCILANFYCLNKVNVEGLKPEHIEAPLMCNDFSVFGKATVDGKHYFGRDFMFPTGGIFEYMFCMTIYNPDDGRLPMVVMNAPGFVGSITTMNIEGVGMGTNILPANNCNPERPGINSAMLMRHATHQSHSAKQLVDLVVNAQRGVSWLYFVADGKNDKAAVIEAGMKTDKLDFPSFVPVDLQVLGLLPNQEFLDRFENQKHQQGVMVRWNNYTYPQEFQKFNQNLFDYYGKKINSKSWGERGYINEKFNSENCPKSHYFPPQRENKDDLILVGNHALIPSMRFCGMNSWTVMVYEHKYNDIQWRYDELNSQLLKAYGTIDLKKAKELIDFLAPYGKFPDYYKHVKTSPDGKHKIIEGCVSLCNMTDKVMHSHFGYYNDEWVTITLPNYVK